jgi:hypothetical protein
MRRGMLGAFCALRSRGQAAESDADAWARLVRGGMVIVVPHANGPGPRQSREGVRRANYCW